MTPAYSEAAAWTSGMGSPLRRSDWLPGSLATCVTPDPTPGGMPVTDRDEALREALTECARQLDWGASEHAASFEIGQEFAARIVATMQDAATALASPRLPLGACEGRLPEHKGEPLTSISRETARAGSDAAVDLAERTLAEGELIDAGEFRLTTPDDFVGLRARTTKALEAVVEHCIPDGYVRVFLQRKEVG